jgi:hypothetical protein
MAQTWWTRGLLLAEELGVPFEIAMIGLEMARRSGETRYLDRAEQLLARIGATVDVAADRCSTVATRATSGQ